jgi:hypothetical protein
MENKSKEYFDFLDGLRESGNVNMFGARPYLMEEFGLDKVKAAQVMADWMSSYRRTSQPPRESGSNGQ